MKCEALSRVCLYQPFLPMFLVLFFKKSKFESNTTAHWLNQTTSQKLFYFYIKNILEISKNVLEKDQ